MRDVIAVALVALVALSGLMLSGTTGAASMKVNDDNRKLGYTLGEQAYELVKEAPTQQNRRCSYECLELCPKSDGWDSSVSSTQGSECGNWCTTRCQKLLQEERN